MKEKIFGIVVIIIFFTTNNASAISIEKQIFDINKNGYSSCGTLEMLESEVKYFFAKDEVKTWSQTITLEKKTYNIGVRASFEVEFSNTNKFASGIGVDNMIDSIIVEINGLKSLYTPWDECNDNSISTGNAITKSYSDSRMAYTYGKYNVKGQGEGTAKGYIEHSIQWDSPISGESKDITISYKYNSLSILFGDGEATVNIWLTFFIDDKEQDIIIYSEKHNHAKEKQNLLKIRHMKIWPIFSNIVRKFKLSELLEKNTEIKDENDQNGVKTSQISSIISPAEFDLVDELIISWPKKEGDENYEVEPFHVQMTAAAQESVKVRINVNKYPYYSPEAGDIIPPNDGRPIFALKAAGVPTDNVIIDETMTSSVWMRDYGPFFIIKDGDVTLVDFNYYGWTAGRLFDNLYPSVYGLKNNIDFDFMANFYLAVQGGNYISNGEGRAFLCWNCIERDNKGITKSEATKRLKHFLGLDEVIYLESQVMAWQGEDDYGDQTGHIDMFCKMLDDDTFLIAEWRDSDPWTNGEMKKITDRNAQKLEKLGYEVVRIPTIRDPENPKTVWSYTNSLILNGKKKVVLISQYGAEEDSEVISIYQNAMSDYEIKPINSTEIIKFYGAIHCTTITRVAK
jgi:agmatine/peptidylarginine deiminase